MNLSHWPVFVFKSKFTAFTVENRGILVLHLVTNAASIWRWLCFDIFCLLELTMVLLNRAYREPVPTTHTQSLYRYYFFACMYAVHGWMVGESIVKKTVDAGFTRMRSIAWYRAILAITFYGGLLFSVCRCSWIDIVLAALKPFLNCSSEVPLSRSLLVISSIFCA